MAKYSILIADDDPHCREAVRESLDRVGLRTLTASCGKEAIEIASERSRRIHASILDMFMPDLSGLETMEVLLRLGHRLPTIFMTADGSRELLLKAMEAGAFALLNKPLSQGLVVVTVNQLLDRFYGEDEEEESAGT